MVNIGCFVIIFVQKLHLVLREANMLPFMEQTTTTPAPAALESPENIRPWFSMQSVLVSIVDCMCLK